MGKMLTVVKEKIGLSPQSPMKRPFSAYFESHLWTTNAFTGQSTPTLSSENGMYEEVKKVSIAFISPLWLASSEELGLEELLAVDESICSFGMGKRALVKTQ